MRKEDFDARAREGILILDGAMGSNLRLAGMPAGASTELWAFEHPEVVLELQRGYVEAGCDILYAPTFSANRLSLGRHGQAGRLEALNRGLVAITRQAAGDKALVAGDLTTVGEPLEPYGDMEYEELLDIYKEQIAVLAGAGADLLVAETMLSIDECACAVEAARAVCDLPVMCSLTVDANGRVLFGGSAAEGVERLQDAGACAVGVNCSVGPDQLEAVVASMKAVARVPLIAKPNAGLPTVDERGVAHYSMDAERFAGAMEKLVAAGATVVGGCCGTTPEYIRALVRKLRG